MVRFSVLLVCFLMTFVGRGGELSAQSLPPNIFPDTANAPFLYGVASGDPTSDGVILWTHLSPDSIAAQADSVYWELAPTSSFSNPLDSGYALTDSSRSWTVKVAVSGLPPATELYYRFCSSGGAWSGIGRSKTAPQNASSSLKFGLASCSSIYSGYFNAYARLADQADLDALIHVGDYIYDFVDQDEEIRVPTPYPTVPVSLDEWRDRHRYYCMDADLRALRAEMPLIQMWDNHDLEDSVGMQAFHEWNPTRLPDSSEADRFFRKISYGNLADIFMIDVNTWRYADSLPDSTPSTLGLTQQAWLINELSNSTAAWKLVGTPKMFSRWGTQALQQYFPSPGGVFDLKSWDGFASERRMILQLIDSLNIHNVVMLSGDTHVAMGGELKYDPADSMFYDPATGQGALGLEVAAASVARGNFDESGLPDWLIDLLVTASRNENPHQQFLDLKQHGYGLLELHPDSIRANWFFTPILQSSPTEILGKSMLALVDEDHWERILTGTPPSHDSFSLNIFPNPFGDELNIRLSLQEETNLKFRLFSLPDGRLISAWEEQGFPGENQFRQGQAERGSGPYLLEIEGEGLLLHRLLIRQEK